MPTKPFCAGDLANARVLVIGHDPRLQVSDTLAQYAFFADYFFRPRPNHRSEAAKYDLARATYGYIGELTGNRYAANQLVLTNLCNVGLPHAPKGRTVLIPEERAKEGIESIRILLDQSQVEIVFAMSLQVNYWLQKLGFYPSVTEFLHKAAPKTSGLSSKPPYYKAQQDKAFQLVCGRTYAANRRRVIPILHVKQWPLKAGYMAAYGQAYKDCISHLSNA